MTVMEVMTVNGGFVEDDARIQDPGSNADSFAPGELIGVAAFVAGGNAGEDFVMRLVDPNGHEHASATIDFEKPEGQTVWVSNWFLGSQLGTWHAEFLTNGELATSFPFQVLD